MQGFGYERPHALARAVALLQAHGSRAVLLAGGTDLIVGLRERRLRPAVVVDIKHVAGLEPSITRADGLVRITADTVLTDVAADQCVRGSFPALAQAAAMIGTVQIRNRATLAGNICNASPAADTAPPLLVYQAQVVAYGPSGTRRIPIGGFFAGPGLTTLAPDEVVTAIELPVPEPHAGSAFGRLSRRRGADLATVSVCAYVDGDGVTRLGFGAVGPRPILIADHSGQLADPASQANMLARLVMTASPISDVRASREYRMSMLAELSQRVLGAATGAATGAAIARRAEGGRR